MGYKTEGMKGKATRLRREMKHLKWERNFELGKKWREKKEKGGEELREQRD